MFARHAANAIAVEQALHAGFLAELGISDQEAAATPLAPTCQAYATYLEAAAYGGSFAEGVAAGFPRTLVFTRCVLPHRARSR